MEILLNMAKTGAVCEKRYKEDINKCLSEIETYMNRTFVSYTTTLFNTDDN